MQQLFQSVPKSDPLKLWPAPDNELDYGHLTDLLDLDKPALSKIGGVSQKSVRLDHRIPRQLKERLEQIAVTCSLVAEFFEGDQLKTAMWFKTPNPMLGNISPRDMIRYGRYKKLLNFVQSALEENAASAA